MKNLTRKSINKAAGSFLSEQGVGDYYDAYLTLLNAKESGNGKDLASDYVVMWEPLDYKTVEEILDLIESNIAVDDVPEFITNIDWVLLKEQKKVLLETIDEFENTNAEQTTIDGLTGILHLIDSIQDYAVDKLGVDENDVFDLDVE